MKLSKSLALIAALGLGASAVAADSQAKNETAVKASKVKPAKKNDIDQEITNARLRAESGSKSKYSFSVSAGYSGGSLQSPFNAQRPNLSGDPDSLAMSGGGFGIDGRYRLNKNVSFTLGTGVYALQPTKGAGKKITVNTKKGPKDINRYYVSDPSFGASYAGKVGRWQMISSFGASYATSTESLEADNVAGFSLGQNMLTTFADGKVTAGMAIGLGWTSYSQYIGNEGSRDITAAIYPYAEYSLSDDYSLRTVFGYFNYFHELGTASPDLLRLANMVKGSSYQSVGVGISVSRDVYVYPNIQFIPDDLDVKKTNVAISAQINML